VVELVQCKEQRKERECFLRVLQLELVVLDRFQLVHTSLVFLQSL